MVVDRYSQPDLKEEPDFAEERTYQIRGRASAGANETSDLIETEQVLDDSAALASVQESTRLLAAETIDGAGDEEAEKDSAENHTLDMHPERSIPRLKHADFARLFSNLRRNAQ